MANLFLFGFLLFAFFDVNVIAIRCIHAYQRNLGSHVTVRTSAPPVRKTTPKFDWQLYERNP